MRYELPRPLGEGLAKGWNREDSFVSTRSSPAMDEKPEDERRIVAVSFKAGPTLPPTVT
jgi:hypothetical protein